MNPERIRAASNVETRRLGEAPPPEQERGREGREVADALRGVLSDLTEQARLKRRVRNLLDIELRDSPDSVLRKEGNKRIGHSRGLAERVKGVLRKMMIGIVLLTADTPMTLVQEAAKYAESERIITDGASEEAPPSEEIPPSQEGIEEVLRVYRESQEAIAATGEGQKTEKNLGREVEELLQRRRQRSKEIADELIDFARDGGAVDELRNAYEALVEGEDVTYGLMSDHLSEAAKTLESSDPETAKKLYAFLGPDKALDFAVRQGDASTVYEQAVERLGGAIIERRDRGSLLHGPELLVSKDAGEVYHHASSLDEERRGAVIRLLEQYIALQQSDLERRLAEVTTGEGTSAIEDQLALLERLRRFREGLQSGRAEVDFGPMPGEEPDVPEEPAE